MNLSQELTRSVQSFLSNCNEHIEKLNIETDLVDLAKHLSQISTISQKHNEINYTPDVIKALSKDEQYKITDSFFALFLHSAKILKDHPTLLNQVFSDHIT